MKLKHLFIVAAAGLVAVACDNKTEKTDPAVPISIEWEGQDIDKRHEFKADEVLNAEGKLKIPVNVVVKADEGVKNFVVNIISDIPGLDATSLTAMGLGESFDLANPGKSEEMLTSLKFPVGDKVVDQKEISMNVTEFIPLIFALADNAKKDGKADFKVTITDNKGNTLSKTVQLDIKRATAPETPAISIVWDGQDIDKRHEFVMSKVLGQDEKGDTYCKVPVVINIDAPKGVKSFVVKIESDILTKEALEAVKFTDEFDLVNPGEFKDALEGFNFPTGDAVKDKTQFTMDITEFVPMIFIASNGKDGKADFKLTITDNEGNMLSKTVQLDIVIG